MSRWVISTTPFCILPYITLYTRRVSCIPANLFKYYCSEDSHHREDPIHEPSSKSRCINGTIARRLSCVCCGLRRFTWSIMPTSKRISCSYCRTLNERGRSRQQQPTLTFLCVCVKFVDRSGSELNLSENVPCRQRSKFESDSSGVQESDREVTNLSVEKKKSSNLNTNWDFLEHVNTGVLWKTVVKIHSVSAQN
jgi:hypothetical protein